MTSSAYSRPRARPRRRVGPGRPGWASRSTIELAFAPSSDCPHCGRRTKTVQGVCADCWGSKGGRQFWLRKQGPKTSKLGGLLGSDPLRLFLLALVAGAVPALLGLALWIWV